MGSIRYRQWPLQLIENKRPRYRHFLQLGNGNPRLESAHGHVIEHTLAHRTDRMITGHGSVPFIVVIGVVHLYLNTGQTLTANTSTTLNLDTPTATAV